LKAGLYILELSDKETAMNFENPFLLLVVGVAVAATGYWLATHFFSATARRERRRRRSNTPVINTSNRPSVKLSVRTRKRRRK
jgi:hypothetical protein